MDTQRTILWVVFGLSVFLLLERWQVYQARLTAPAPAVTAPAPSASPATGAPGPAEVPAPSAQPSARATAVPSEVTPPATSAEHVKIETDVLRAEFDPAGASLVRVELPEQRVAPDWTEQGVAKLLGLTDFLHAHDVGRSTGALHGTAHVVLLDTSGGRVYQAQTGLIGGPTSTSFPNHRTSLFEVKDGSRTLAAGQDSLVVQFEAQSDGVRLVKTFTFRRGHYDIEVAHEITNVGTAPVSPTLYLQLERDGGKAPDYTYFARSYTGPAFYSDADKYRKVSFEDIDKNNADDAKPADRWAPMKPADNGWVAMVQHYFVAAWVPIGTAGREFYAEAIERGRLYRVGERLNLGSLASGASTALKSVLYVGPQDQRTLAGITPGLDLVADYGWLTPIAKPLFWLLGSLHWVVRNWGWAIVLLTVLIKGVFYPLSAASYKSMAKMKDLQPRLVKLREQYGEDRQKLQLAMMELYKHEKINPVMGCLPVLVQIPVFIALYWVLLSSVEMRNAPWMLWIRDLATPDPWFVLPVVMIASMWIQYKLNPTPPDPVQAKMMAVMPFVFGAMFFFFPAGLVLYWVVNNALSILQQWRISKIVARSKKAGH